jgi:hypothetical protein
MENLPVDTLRNARLVCRMWKQEADRSMYSRPSINLHSHANVVKALVTLKRVTNDNGINRKTHELIADDFYLDTREMFDLCSRLKNSLSSLILNDGIISRGGYMRIMRIVGPNLAKLSLGTLKTNEGSYFKYFPVPDNLGNNMVFPQMKNLCWFSYTGIPEDPTSTLLSSVAISCPNLVRAFCSSPFAENPNNLEHLTLPRLRNLKFVFTPSGLVRGGKK